MQTSAAPAVKLDQVQLIPVEKIKPSPFNARKDFPKEYIAELGASLLRDGQQTPVKVRPVKDGFELVFGECRWRGATAAGVPQLKAIVEAMDDARAEHLCLIENIKRRDLTVFEEAEKLKRLHEVHKVKVDDLALQVGLSVRTVHENIKLATLNKTVRELVTRAENPMPVSLAKLIARLPQAVQIQASESAEDYGDQWMTHEELEDHIREEYMVDLRHAPFATNLKGFPCLADTCDACPRNAKNSKDEYPELKGGNICTSPENYRKKCDAYAKAVVADAKKTGAVVLEGLEAEKAIGGMGGYVPLSNELWVGNERKSLKDVLPKKSELKTAIALDDEGEVVTVAKREDVQAALKKAGKTSLANSYEVTGKYSSPAGSSGGSSMHDEQAKRRKKLLARREVAALAIDALADHQHTTAGDDVFLKLIGLGLTQGRIDNDGLQLMLKQWFGSEKKTDYGPHAAAKLLDAAKGAELRRTMVRLAMSGGLTAGGTWSDSHAGELLAGLKLYGLKLERFQDAAKKAKVTKDAAKKKPAAKKPDAKVKKAV